MKEPLIVIIVLAVLALLFCIFRKDIAEETIAGHKFIVSHGAYSTSLIHSPNCPCLKP